MVTTSQATEPQLNCRGPHKSFGLEQKSSYNSVNICTFGTARTGTVLSYMYMNAESRCITIVIE